MTMEPAEVGHPATPAQSSATVRSSPPKYADETHVGSTNHMTRALYAANFINDDYLPDLLRDDGAQDGQEESLLERYSNSLTDFSPSTCATVQATLYRCSDGRSQLDGDLRLPSLSSGPTPSRDVRVQSPDWRAGYWKSEVSRLREEVASLTTVANRARDEAQQAALRMDQLEHSWPVRGDQLPRGEPASRRDGPTGAPLSVRAPIPQTNSPRTQEACLQRHVLQLEDDSLMRWCSRPGAPGLDPSALHSGPPQVAQESTSLSPLGGGPGSSQPRG